MKKICLRLAIIGMIFYWYTSLWYTKTDCQNADLLATRGIIKYHATCSDYNLDSPILRQEAAGIVLNLWDVTKKIVSISPPWQYFCRNIFADVSAFIPNSWACRAIETLARDGIISQSNSDRYGRVYFRPLQNISSAEILAMVFSAVGIDYRGVSIEENFFNGLNIAPWQIPLLQFSYNQSFFPSIGTFYPNNFATRREVFDYVIKVLALQSPNQVSAQCGTSLNSCTQGSFSDIADVGSVQLWKCSGNGGLVVTCSSARTDNICTVWQFFSNNSCQQCSIKPLNSSYTTQNSCEWSCDTNYSQNGNTCTYTVPVIPQNCGIGQYNSGNACVQCNIKPLNAQFNTANSCLWECSQGFMKVWNTCINNTQSCVVGMYPSNNTCQICTSKPSNSHYTTANSCDWTCASGYRREWNLCVWNVIVNQGPCGIQENTCTSGVFSDAVDFGTFANWICVWANNIPTACSIQKNSTNSCGIGRYFSNNSCLSCTTKPANSIYTTSNTCDFSCTTGYRREGNLCIQNTAQCGVWQYTVGSSCQTCFTKPNNAQYTTSNTCDWSCASGYRREGNFCIVDNVLQAQCGTQENICISGTFSDAVDFGNLSNWICIGSNNSALACSVQKSTTTSCSLWQYLSNNVCQSCTTKPLNSSYTSSNSCNWSCNAWYSNENNTCVITNTSSCFTDRFPYCIPFSV